MILTFSSVKSASVIPWTVRPCSAAAAITSSSPSPRMTPWQSGKSRLQSTGSPSSRYLLSGRRHDEYVARRFGRQSGPVGLTSGTAGATLRRGHNPLLDHERSVVEVRPLGHRGVVCVHVVPPEECES